MSSKVHTLQETAYADKMNKEQWKWLASPRPLLLIIGIAVLLRIASALIQGEHVGALPGIHDQLSYDGLARRVLAGHGFTFAEDHWPATRAGEPTAHWSYLYTLYLTAVYKLFGANPLIARLLQAVIAGVLHCWLAWRIGRRIFSPPVGIVAAGLSAVYIYFWYYAGALITESFYIVAILWVFDVALRLTGIGSEENRQVKQNLRSWPQWTELGVALGVAILLRQLFLLFTPFLFLWLWWHCTGSPGQSQNLTHTLSATRTQWKASFWPGMELSIFILVVTILPWTVRNYKAFGLFVPLNTNAGYAFFWGNHPIYGTHFVGILPGDGPSYYELIPPELLHLNEAALDQALLQHGIDFVRADPIRYGLLSLSRIREYFKFWPSPDSGLLSNLARVASFGLSLPFILHGLYLALRVSRRGSGAPSRPAVLLLSLFILVYTTIHLLSWALVRYRLPVDAIFMFFAAYSLITLAGQLHVRRIAIKS